MNRCPRGLRGHAATAAAIAGLLLGGTSADGAPDRAGLPRVLLLGDSHLAGTAWGPLLRRARDEASATPSGGFGLRAADTGCAAVEAGNEAWRQAGSGPQGLAGPGLEAAHSGDSLRLRGRWERLRIHVVAGSAGVTLVAEGRSTESRTGPGAALEILEAGPGEEALVVARAKGARILGVGCEAAGSGSWFATVGIPGARAERLLSIPEPLLKASLLAEAPSRVVLAYGTNEARDPAFSEAGLAETVREVVSRIRRALPSAEVVVLGAPDQGGVPASRLDAVVRAQRRAARESGARFVDLRAEMGGPGTAVAWARLASPLAAPDLVHFTAAGYRELALVVAMPVAGVQPSSIPAAAPVGAAPGTAAARSTRGLDGGGSGGIRSYRDGSGRLVLTNLGPPPPRGELAGGRRR